MHNSPSRMRLAVALACIACARAAHASDPRATGLGQPFTPTNLPMPAAQVRNVGHGQPFNTIQLAINAANDGDIVLVQTGSYGAFTIDGKGVSVVEDRGHVVSTGAVTIRNVPAGSAVLVQGFTIGTGLGSTAGVNASNNAGVLRIDACTCAASGPRVGASFVNCAAVSMHACAFYGGTDTITGPRLGITASASEVALHDSFAYGHAGQWITVSGNPVLQPPAAGISLTGGTLNIAGGEVLGGTGAFGFDGDCVRGPEPTPGTQGAVGVQFASGATAVVLDALIAGGEGGDGGVGEEGCAASNGAPGAAFSAPESVTTLAGAHRRMTSIPPARERETLPMHIVGAPGDRVYLAFSPHAAHVADLSRNGVRYFELPPRRMLLGMVNAVGVLDTTFYVPSFVPAGKGERWFAQPVHVDIGGDVWLGPAVDLTMLDGSF